MSYVVLVICMWAWHGLESGMGHETAFVYASEINPGWRGLAYEGDPLRASTSVFYHLAYTLARVASQDGSFVTYQLVYAALWCARGFLVFWIVRMLGAPDGASFLAGAFTILHAADTSLNWVGQLNQFGFIFWMLIAFHFILRAVEHEKSPALSGSFAFASTVAAGICLLSYESPLTLLVLFPVLAISLFDRWSLSKLRILAIYYAAPAFYCLVSAFVYVLRTRPQSYQFTVLRSDWSVVAIMADWVHNTWQSLAFWQWPANYMGFAREAGLTGVVVVASSVLASAVLLLTYLLLSRRRDTDGTSRALYARLAFLGISMIVLSFPVYLLLEGSTAAWRTQLLSGPGAGILFASAVSLVKVLGTPIPGLQLTAAAVVSAAVAIHGVWASQSQALYHRLHWDKHRQIVANVLAVAPRVKEHTLLVLVNDATNPLIFGHNMWWDLATRLAYPGRRVGGLYFEGPDRPAAGARLHVAARKARIQSDFRLLFDEVDIANLLILNVGPDSHVTVAARVPAWLGLAPEMASHYDPASVIEEGPPDSRAVRRYLPRD